MVKGPCFVWQNRSGRSLKFPKTPGFSHEEQNRKTVVAPSFHHAILKVWFEIDFVANVRRVNLRSPAVTDLELMCLKAFGHLEQLDLVVSHSW